MNAKSIACIALLAVVCGAAHAETIAVVVVDRDPPSASERTLSFVEQGAMERMFDLGHIVFNLGYDPDDEAMFVRAIYDAFDGGASYLVFLAVARGSLERLTARPVSVTVTVIDVRTERTLLETLVLATEIPRNTDMGVDLLAERLGDLGATVALESILDGATAW